MVDVPLTSVPFRPAGGGRKRRGGTRSGVGWREGMCIALYLLVFVGLGEAQPPRSGGGNSRKRESGRTRNAFKDPSTNRTLPETDVAGNKLDPLFDKSSDIGKEEVQFEEELIQQYITTSCSIIYPGLPQSRCDLSEYPALVNVSCRLSLEAFGASVSVDSGALDADAYVLIGSRTSCGGNGQCVASACTVNGYPCPWPAINENATSYSELYTCNNGTTYLNELAFVTDPSPLSADEVAELTSDQMSDAFDEALSNANVGFFLPDCCICEGRFEPPLCLVLPPLPEDDNLAWWIIVIVAVAGAASAVIASLFCFWRYRNTEVYVKAWELRSLQTRPPMPGETATFCWTDIQSSTPMWEWDPFVMEQAVRLHFNVMRVLLKKFNGYETQTEGDALMCVFHNESDAVAWAVSVQKELLYPEEILKGSRGAGMRKQVMDWPPKLLAHPEACEVTGLDGETLFRGLRLRIGIHSGMLHEEGDEILDQAANGSLDGSDVAQADAAPASVFADDIPAGGDIPTGDKDQEDNDPSNDTPDSASSHSPSFLLESEDAGSDEVQKKRQAVSWGSFFRILVIGESKEQKRKRRWQNGRPVREGFSEMFPRRQHRGDVAVADVNTRQGRFHYWGKAVDITKFVSDLPSGGIIATTGETMSHVPMGGVPMSIQLFSLGSYLLSTDHEEKEIMVILPDALTERLKEVKTIIAPITQLTPGCFQAPGFNHQWEHDWKTAVKGSDVAVTAPMPTGNRLAPLDGEPMTRMLPSVTIVFVMIHGKEAVYQYSRKLAYNSISLLVRCVRDSLLSCADGYECEESDGDFVLAFARPENALQFCAKMQEDLMSVKWPEELLEMDENTEMFAPGQVDGGEILLYRGLRVRCGLSEGNPTAIRPHPGTGRAAYFGPLMNRSSRICKLSAPGMVICPLSTWNAAYLSVSTETYLKSDNSGAPSIQSSLRDVLDSELLEFNNAEEDKIVAVLLGTQKLKGIEENIDIVQVSTPSLSLRPIPMRFKRSIATQGKSSLRTALSTWRGGDASQPTRKNQ